MLLLASLCIGSCATDSRIPPGTPESSAQLPAGTISAADAERSRDRVAIGKSTKADVAAALGRAGATLAFDSGYEVWVYRIMPVRVDKQTAGELVVLFAPSGTLAKTRVRPPGVRTPE